MCGLLSSHTINGKLQNNKIKHDDYCTICLDVKLIVSFKLTLVKDHYSY